MKKNLYFILLLASCLTTIINAQTPSWQWALSAGAPINEDYGHAVFVDGSANVYSTGSFATNTLTIGTSSLTRAGLGNVFVVKQDASGNVIWAKNFGCSTGTLVGGGIGYGISADATGNVYVAGIFYTALIVGTTTLTTVDTTSGGGNFGDIFITKLDPLGNVIWAKSAGGKISDAARGISVDAAGNVFLTGSFSSRYIAFGTTTVTATTNNSPFVTTDIFVAKYNSSGNLQWVKNTGTNGADEGRGISIDASGNIVVTGTFYLTPITFGSTTLTASSAINLFVVKYDTGGNVLWAKTATGFGSGTKNHGAASISSDVNNNVFITGSYQASTLTIGSVSLTNTSGFLVAKFDANGNVLWAKSTTGGNAVGNGISTDGLGNTYVTGHFSSTSSSFGTSTITNANTGGSSEDIFIVKYDPSGVVSWVKSGGSVARDISNGISSNANGEVAITGQITTTVTLGTYTLNCGGGGTYNDLFIAKIGTATAGIKQNFENLGVSIYPNPSNGSFSIEIKNPIEEQITVKVYDLLGKVIYSSKLNSNASNIHLKDITKGIYLLELSTKTTSSTRKIIID